MISQTGRLRIEQRFKELRKAKRPGLVTFITAGDPNKKISKEILEKLPSSGADIIEIGMPFSDPMADGPAIQASSLRSLNNGNSMRDTLKMVSDFRKVDHKTPIILKLNKRNIGCEIMNLSSACSCHNILLAEKRNFLSFFIFN